jgi:hypothetical protein
MKVYPLSLIVLFACTFAVAAEKDNSIAERKKHVLKEMDFRLSKLETAKSCFNSAADLGAMRHCRQELNSRRKKAK